MMLSIAPGACAPCGVQAAEPAYAELLVHARARTCTQVAEGVATAGVVVMLARKYRVSLPVLTAVAQVLDGNITAREAVYEIMNLPQIEEV